MSSGLYRSELKHKFVGTLLSPKYAGKGFGKIFGLPRKSGYAIAGETSITTGEIHATIYDSLASEREVGTLVVRPDLSWKVRLLGKESKEGKLNPSWKSKMLYALNWGISKLS